MPGPLDECRRRRRTGSGRSRFGIAFLFIAAVRAASGGGIGWQAWFGGLLAVTGLAGMITPDIGGLLLPALLVIVGVLLLMPRGALRR